ncbi:MAG TPA: bacillithiol biosynthesis cysteine-adding enzyme BshC [Chitinophagaceae bacterium]|nr:bacillithiol biosynthesis cysteine-adding enzyme BshC [Chitinophagaceae bacterium]
MECNATRIAYRQTNAFTSIITDYLDRVAALQPFYHAFPDLDGIKQAIEARQAFPNNRTVLVNELKKQYAQLKTSVETEKNIAALANATTFTITTAHQPNLFTGPLYFIYKILHAIRLAESCKTWLPQYDFVPVYYMGSEDADLDELGHFNIGGEKKIWNTKQTGAVGRMKIDKELIKLIQSVEGQLTVLPHGEEILSLVKDSYFEGRTIQDATFHLVNALFAEYGLVILMPDNAALKNGMQKIFEDDLLHQTASSIVEQTARKLESAGYKVQANPREINLFYLKDNIRERIELRNDEYAILNTQSSFSKDDILKELKENPERFSPNVILRGLFQETILPNIAFIGGGGETAYWLQLKDLFQHYKVPFPLLVLRNSFLVVEEKMTDKIEKIGFSLPELFLSEQELLNKLVQRDTQQKLKLNGTYTETEQIYDAIRKQASAIDSTLSKHVEALKTNTLYRLQELEKKMLRAEKRKFGDQQRHIQSIKEKLFPRNGLQERIDNFMWYYAKWGKEFFRELYRHSLSLEQEFVVLQEQ